MKTVIADTETAIKAAEWCCDHLQNSNWALVLAGPADRRRYEFTFSEEQDYLLFTLSF